MGKTRERQGRDPNNGAQAPPEQSYFWMQLSLEPSNRPSRSDARASRARCPAAEGGEERRARTRLVNLIVLVSTIALSGGKSRKLLGISQEILLSVQSCFYHALRTVSENAYVKCGVVIILASNRRDEVGLFIFLGDKLYIFSSKRAN